MLLNSPPIVGEGQGVGSVFRMIEHGRATPLKLNLKLNIKFLMLRECPFGQKSNKFYQKSINFFLIIFFYIC